MIYERHSKSHFALSSSVSFYSQFILLSSFPFLPRPFVVSHGCADANNSLRTTLKQRLERELNPVSRIDYQSLNNFLLLLPPRRRIIDEYLRHWSPLILDRSCEIKKHSSFPAASGHASVSSGLCSRLSSSPRSRDES